MKFLQDGCGSALGEKGGPCSAQFLEETVLFNLSNCLELTSGELDLVILANIQAFTRIDCVGEKRNRSPRCSFHFQGRPICKDMFLHLYGIGYSRFQRLKEHNEEHGICPRTHGNTNRVPENATPHSTIKDFRIFIENYVEENFLPLRKGSTLGLVFVPPPTIFQRAHAGHFMPEGSVKGATTSMSALNARPNTQPVNVGSPQPSSTLMLENSDRQLLLRVLGSQPVTPVKVDRIKSLLAGYSLPLKTFLVDGFRSGFRISYIGEYSQYLNLLIYKVRYTVRMWLSQN